MAISFRKTKKVGPLLLSISKKGVGVSAGVRGARIGRSPGGEKYVSASAAGFTTRKKLRGNPDTSSAATLAVILLGAGVFLAFVLMIIAFAIISAR